MYFQEINIITTSKCDEKQEFWTLKTKNIHEFTSHYLVEDDGGP